MTVETLIATMNQKNHDILTRMNIQTDAIVGNQSIEDKIERFSFEGKKIQFLTLNEKGVGLNRNNALMRAKSDICVLADDDMVFIDGYEKIVLEQFQKYQKADVLIFNLLEEKPIQPITLKDMSVTKLNFMKYGAARIAFRREKVTMNGISFNLNFGGGTSFSSGEDTLFLNECLNKKLKIIAVNVSLAYLNDARESTWFAGYSEKFFYDKGIIFKLVAPKIYKLYILRFALLKQKLYKKEMPWFKAYKFMISGSKHV